MKKKPRNIDYVMILSVLLILSIIMNIYMSVKNVNYRYKLGKQSYIEAENIRQRNESNMDILSKCIDEGSIANSDLLKLYKNYDVISTDIIGLWQQYGAYTENGLPAFLKVIKSDKVIENNIHVKIKDYISSTLTREMENNNSKLILIDDELDRFVSMYEMSEGIYNYFNDFNTNILLGASGEDKEKKVIKNHYWIDMLEGIYNINGEYADVQWENENTELVADTNIDDKD